MNVLHHRHGEGQQAFSHISVAMETDYTESFRVSPYPSFFTFQQQNEKQMCKYFILSVVYLVYIKYYYFKLPVLIFYRYILLEQCE